MKGKQSLGHSCASEVLCEEKSDFRDSIGKQLLILRNDIN